MANQDLSLLTSVIESANEQIPTFVRQCLINCSAQTQQIEHPLDQDVINNLKNIEGSLRDSDDDYQIFMFVDQIKELWKIVIGKSIKCLRFFDKREPFIENASKHPVAYGINELGSYFEEYTQFESMLYGGGKYYRDHVVHVFRVWLLGLNCLLENQSDYLERITIQKNVEVNNLEKLSIWSMIALTHDLGYPLEKAQGIIEKTKSMMKTFVSNPTISMDLSFNGIQTNMNDYVVRFIRSKMRECKPLCVQNRENQEENQEEKHYVARLQPKYYYKFEKSLEGYKHGILSATIIYKLFIYFLESDFSINEDYEFNEEEARQFYIRREILRTISSHTCHDVYHLDMMNFSFLLIMMDDAQEWGRKRISELYVKKSSNYDFESVTAYFGEAGEYGTYRDEGEDKNVNKFEMKENFTFPSNEEENVKEVLKSLWQQRKGYEEIFRDGQDTAKRNFVFSKQSSIELKKNKPIKFIVSFLINNDRAPVFQVKVNSASQAAVHEKYALDYMKKVFVNQQVTLVNDEAGTNSSTYEVSRK